ncbi:MAG: 3-oxoacyl-[acyl-carrier-protein] reductase [Clostridia bacterium]|nr:3-oxoacyl-[acyl-carrier-protein] reductase [Clostridia bacterium]
MAKTAVITGGASGIGRQTALRLAEEIDNIVILDRNVEAAQDMIDEFLASGKGAKAIALDVTDFAAVKETATEIKKEFGSIDILVNCAGIRKDGLLAMMKEEAFDQVIDVNLKGTFNMIRHIGPIMMKQRGGSIINISSLAGVMGNAGQVNYSASKAGVIGITKSVARELVSRGVRCNAIAPGFIGTEMTAEFEDNDAVLETIPMKRMGSPEEVAELIAFLASEKSSYITGQVINIDGGMDI